MEQPVEHKIQRILAPYDFSEPSRIALSWAQDLAARYGAQLTLLHVYQPPTYVMPPDAAMVAGAEVQAKEVAEIDSALTKAAQAAQTAQTAGAPIHTRIAQGDPSQEILREVQDGKHDLLVMGTHGHTWLRHVLLGSVAERVVRHATCPVLTVPPKGAR